MMTAPKGTGGVKVGGNYAASFLMKNQQKVLLIVYIGSCNSHQIEEVGAATLLNNKDNKFITLILNQFYQASQSIH